MQPRERQEKREEKMLAFAAAKAGRSRGRQRPEEECSLRTAFQRDRDRILYAKSFRRLKHKTQVFLAPTGDHYRTRLTHTLEVSQIGRTMARALMLNEDLVEAIALGHDLGHTPFGHAGESMLNQLLPQGFRHHEQSLRVVDLLERDGVGLNLTQEVRMGILHHSKGRRGFLDPDQDALDKADGLSLEARLVRAADLMAYIAHDLDDAVRGGVLGREELPREVAEVLGDRLSRQIDTMVRDLVAHSQAEEGEGAVAMSPRVSGAMLQMREFLFGRVYDNPEVHADFDRASKIIRELFERLMAEDGFWTRWVGGAPADDAQRRQREAADYLAGMTDRFALDVYEDEFLPRPWVRL